MSEPKTIELTERQLLYRYLWGESRFTRANLRSAINILKRARALLTPPGAWIRGESMGHRSTPTARHVSQWDARKRRLPINCYCSIGAIHAASPRSDRGALLARMLLKFELDESDHEYHPFGMGIVYWNDDVVKRHAQVLRMFDKTIEHAQADLDNGIV